METFMETRPKFPAWKLLETRPHGKTRKPAPGKELREQPMETFWKLFGNSPVSFHHPL